MKLGHLTPGRVGLLALAAALFLVLSWVPLSSGELWGHINQGAWVLEERELPDEDPFMPLARGMEVVDGSWLARVGLAVVSESTAAGGLASLFALALVVMLALLARVYRMRSGHTRAALATLAAVMVLGWSRFSAFGPETWGLLLFALLLWLEAREEGRPATGRGPGSWIALGLIFALWANVHPSFVAGWVVLTATAAARAVGAVRDRRSAPAALADPATRRAIWRLELAVAATLLNPYGARLLVHAVSFPAHPNLRSLADWRPLAVGSVEGVAFALAWIVLLALVGLGGRRLGLRGFLLVVLFGMAAAWGARMLAWFAPVFGWVLAPLLTRSPSSEGTSEGEAGGARHPLFAAGPVWSAAGLVVLWIAFSLSPLSNVVFGRSDLPAGRIERSTPVALTRYLLDEAPQGQTFAPLWWSDYLVAFTPKGAAPFVTSSVHLAPRQVWRDYLRIASAEGGWERALDRYGVDLVIVDRVRQRALGRGLRELAGWRLTHEDLQALVFRRSDGGLDRVATTAAAEEAP